MSRIILSDDQLQTVHTATDSVEIRDQQGNLIGYVTRPPSADEIAEATRRLQSDGPWESTKEVLDSLKSMESR